MEIERLRKELTDLLNKIVAHSDYYSEGKPLSSLEVDILLGKLHKMQERFILLKYKLREEEEARKRASNQVSSALSPKNNVEQQLEGGVDQNIPEDSDTEFTSQPSNEQASTLTSLAEQLQQKPIENLMEVFSLNDRYLYANELFGKDMAAFNECVKAIERCKTLEEAKVIISKIATTLQLEDGNAHIQSFTHYIERRFP